MNEQDAIAAAEAYAAANLSGLGDHDWQATEFDGGWYLVPTGAHLAFNTGVMGVVVTDDGAVHPESSSQPPSTIVARYARR